MPLAVADSSAAIVWDTQAGSCPSGKQGRPKLFVTLRVMTEHSIVCIRPIVGRTSRRR